MVKYDNSINNNILLGEIGKTYRFSTVGNEYIYYVTFLRGWNSDLQLIEEMYYEQTVQFNSETNTFYISKTDWNTLPYCMQ